MPHVIMYTCRGSFDYSFLYHYYSFMFLLDFKLGFFFTFFALKIRNNRKGHIHTSPHGDLGNIFLRKAIVSTHTCTHTVPAKKYQETLLSSETEIYPNLTQT